MIVKEENTHVGVSPTVESCFAEGDLYSTCILHFNQWMSGSFFEISSSLLTPYNPFILVLSFSSAGGSPHINDVTKLISLSLLSSNFPVHPDVCKAANFNYLIESIFYFECLINKYSKKKSLPLIYKKNCILSNIITLHIFHVLFDWIKKMRIDNRFI